MSASGPDVPGVSETFERSEANAGSIASYLGWAVGGVVGSLAFGLTGIIVSIFRGGSSAIAAFFDGLANFAESIPGGAGDIVASGATTTAAAVSSNGIIAFPLTIIIVVGTSYLIFVLTDITERPIPFVPFLGGDD
jgi:hypothetical protein